MQRCISSNAGEKKIAQFSTSCVYTHVQKSHLVPISENVADEILVGLLLSQNCALDHTHFFLLLLHVRIDLVCAYVCVCARARGGQLL